MLALVIPDRMLTSWEFGDVGSDVRDVCDVGQTCWIWDRMLMLGLDVCDVLGCLRIRTGRL